MCRTQVVIATVLLGLTVGSAKYVPDLGSNDFDSIVDGSSHTLLEFYAPWCGHCKSLAPEYKKVGELFDSTKDVVIAQVDADKHKDLGSKWGVKGFPTLKYLPKGKTDPSDAEDVNVERSAEALTEFVNGRAGTSKKYAAEPVSVITLTEGNFDEVVKDSSKYRLVEFFAPWCGHCKKLAPIYNELAKLYESEPDVSIAALDMDAHASLGEPFEVKGFPTLLFFEKEKVDEPTPYKGGRDLKSFVEFINEQAGTDLAEDGGVVSNGGVVESLASMVKMFMTGSTKEAISGTLKEASSLAGRAAQNAAYYSKVMANVGAKGEGFLSTESARLKKTLETSGDALTTVQKRSFQRRLNALDQFINHETIARDEL